MKRNLIALLVVIVALALVAPVAATRTPAASTGAAAQVEGETIRIGTNAEYPPFEEVAEDGSFVGFDIDLMEALAADAGFEIEWINTRWDGIFFALSEGEFDAVISAATITSQRERIVDFSNPYFVASQSISVTSENAEAIVTPEDLAGLRVGVQTGTTGDFFASEIEGVEVVRFEETPLAFDALGAGEVEAVIADTPAAAAIIANQPDLDAQIVGDPLTAEFYGVAVRPDFPELLEALNVSIANVFDDGTYNEIHEEWFGAPAPDFLLEGDYELEIIEVDPTSPSSVANYYLHTVFVLQDFEELQAIACPDIFEGDDAITEEDFADIADFDFDFSGLDYEETVDGETATVTATGTVVVDDGTEVVELDFADFLEGDLELVQDEEGNWLACPAEG